MRRCPPVPRESRPYPEKEERDKVTHIRHSQRPDMREIQRHYEALEKSKLGVLAHVASQHSVLDVLYGGDAGRPMPSWTHQTTPEIGVQDQQHTGRCWIFATLQVLGHVFRSQYGISNHRATFSEGYIGFWDLYEKSRLFLHVAYDTRCMPLDDPSLCELLKGGISDGGDYIFCLNLMDRYGVVPTEYYPNSSYGSMSTEALVTLLNQVLRDNAITLRTSGDKSLIPSMLTNIFALLCMGLGTPPAPWKNLDWQIDQCETFSSFAHPLLVPRVAAGAAPIQQAASASIQQSESPVVDSSLPPEPVPWRPSAPQTYPIKVPPKSTTQDDSLSALAAALGAPEAEVPPPSPAASAAHMGETSAASAVPVVETPPSPTGSAVTAPGLPDNEFDLAGPPATIPSTTYIVTGEDVALSGAPLLSGARAERAVVTIPTREANEACLERTCRQAGIIDRIRDRFRRCRPIPPEGSSEFLPKFMPDEGCLLGRSRDQGCRLSHTIREQCAPSERPVEEKAMSFDYTPRDFYHRFLMSVRFVPVVCDPRYPPGTRIVSNDANMYGGLPSLYLNVTIDDIQDYAIASLKRNIPVWFACDVKKQLTPEGGRMCSHTDRLNELLPRPHKAGTKLQEIRHFNAIANHALVISAVSMKKGKPDAWRIVNSWGDLGRHGGIFVACNDWFREHVYSINVIYDTMTREHKADVNMKLKRPTVHLGPFDPSVI